jgi:KDO2-lipid IV(A) lauroyltransferase
VKPRSRRKPKWHKTAANAAAYLVARTAVGLVSTLPFRAAGVLGEWAGTLTYLLAREERNRALRHLRWAFGDAHTRGERRRLALRMFRHFGRSAAEAFAAIKLSTPEMETYVENPGELEAQLRSVLNEGKGLIAMTGHLGNWELIGSLGARYVPTHVVANRFRFEPFNRLAEKLRGGGNLRTIYLNESPREIVRALKNNEAVGLLPDQDIRRLPGTYVRFFGRWAWTPIGPVLCAKLSGAPMIPYFLVRKGRRYFVEIGKPVPMVFTGDRKKDLRDNTQRWSDAYEAVIRRYPDQWGWNHLRWNTQPSEVPQAFHRSAWFPPPEKRSKRGDAK